MRCISPTRATSTDSGDYRLFTLITHTRVRRRDTSRLPERLESGVGGVVADRFATRDRDDVANGRAALLTVVLRAAMIGPWSSLSSRRRAALTRCLLAG